MVVSTKDNLSRNDRTFTLRKKYAAKIEANPSMDTKLWKKIYKTFVNDLEYQVQKINEIIKTFHAIEAKATGIQKEFQQFITHEENQIKHLMANVQKGLQTLQAQIKETKCGLIQGETSFTPECLKARKLRMQENQLESKMFSANEPHRENLMAYYGQGKKVLEFRSHAHVTISQFKDKTDSNKLILDQLDTAGVDMGELEARNIMDLEVQKEMKELKAYLERMDNFLIDTKNGLTQKLIWG